MEPTYDYNYDSLTEKKKEFLPIEETDFGFVQKTSYHQPELFDEEVVDIQSPFATTVSQGTQIFSFLVLGDQNAGKSTFLHSFTFQYDPNFLEITSYLPMLSASFMNTRFFFDDSTHKKRKLEFKPIDEPPFLDTDIARGMFLLTREDFLFFLNEFSVPWEELNLLDDTRYIVVQFIEIGGDHLDSLIQYQQNKNQQHTALQDILQKSWNLLLESFRTIYFINASTLFQIQQENEMVTLDSTNVSKLLSRLGFLNSALPSGHQILLYISRMPYSSQITFTNVEQVLKEHKISGTILSTHSMVDFVRFFLELACKQFSWKIEVVDVLPTHHINEDGSLNPAEIVTTLKNCFQSKMIHSQKQPENFVLQHLVQCYKEEIKFTVEKTKDQTFYSVYWISEEEFTNYLMDIDFIEVPPPILAQRFSIVAEKLVEFGVCIPLWKSNHSNIHIILQHASGSFRWNPPHEEESPSIQNNQPSVVVPTLKKNQNKKTISIRFPHFAPLFHILEIYFVRNIPPEFWFTGKKFEMQEEGRKQIEQAQQQLEHFLADRWNKLLSCALSQDASLTKRYADTFFWMVEEWVMCERLLKEATQTIHSSLQLPCDEPTWSRLKPLLHLESAQQNPNNQHGVEVVLKVV